MYKLNPLSLTDFYKTGHIFQYPEGTTEVYSNFTPRSARLAPVLPEYFDGKIVWFGLQALIQACLIDLWNEEFFKRPKAAAVARYKRRMDTALGKDAVAVEHIAALHDLGFLPIEIRSLPEGSRVNLRVPVMTLVNTRPEGYWVTNYLETLLSSELWKPTTSATIAYEYRKLVADYADRTGSPEAFLDWQCHDFSFRGMSGAGDAVASGAGHLLSFYGTDSIPSIDFLEDYYGANADTEMIGGSVPATEHSVMCMGGKDGELETFRRLVTQLYPSGVVSIVSDTWSFFKVLTVYAPALKSEILARKPNAQGLAKVVFRPDSGDPVFILCGYRTARVASREHLDNLDSGAEVVYLEDEQRYYRIEISGCLGKELTEAEVKGAVECLWDVFGGTATEKGFRVLNEQVGLIYGDSITLLRAQAILQRLEEKGFASCNVVFGLGSFTYQYVTRDSFGWAVKATSGVVNGERRALEKNPETDSGTKRSARGLLRVEREGNDFVLYEDQTEEQAAGGELRPIFRDGVLLVEDTLATIRKRLKG